MIKNRTKSANHVTLKNDTPAGVYSWYQHGAYPLKTDNDFNRMTTDNVFAESQTGISHEFHATDFRLNIPRNAKVLGVKAKLHLTNKYGTVNEYTSSLIIGTEKKGANKSQGAVLNNGYKEYGSSTDLWNLSDLTPTQINSQDFGFAFAVQTGANSGIDVEYLEIVVYYDDIYVESGELIFPQETGRKQLFCNIFDKNYEYVGGITDVDLSENIQFVRTVENNYGQVILNLKYSYDEFLSFHGKIKINNLIDFYITDKNATNYRIYTGTISGFTYTRNSSAVHVSILVLPSSSIFSHRILRQSTKTTLDFDDDLGAIIREIIDLASSFTSWTTSSIPLISANRKYTFKGNTISEALRICMKLAPKNWFGFINRKNIYYFKNVENSTKHYITEPQIDSLETTTSNLNVVNTVYFSGGNNLYIKINDANSVNSFGEIEQLVSDNRVTDSTTATQISSQIIENAKNPISTVRLTLIDDNFSSEHGVDIEKFEIGDKIKLVSSDVQSIGRNLATDSLNIYNKNLYITKIIYKFDKIILECSDVWLNSRRRIEDVKEDIKTEQFKNLPTNYN